MAMAMVLALWGGGVAPAFAQSATEAAEARQAETAVEPPAIAQTEDAPLSTPLMSRFVIDEIVRLRADLERTRADLIERQNEREYAIAREATAYARNAIEVFFFVITAVASLAALIGWNTLRDVKKRIREVAEKRVELITSGYAQRLEALEEELKEKSATLRLTQKEIDETNAIHSLWLRAGQEPSDAGKISVYDEILRVRPDDVEALTFKADAALGLNEPQWAISLANRALAIDPGNAQAHYHRACALAWTDRDVEALEDLAIAISASDAFRELALSDPAFQRIRETERFQTVLGGEQIVPIAGAGKTEALNENAA